MNTLELTPIELSPEVATLDLAKVDLQAVALAQFGDWRGDVAAATSKLKDVVLDLSTQTKVDEAKSLRQRTVNEPIAEVRKVSKALKSKLASVSKAIGAEEEAAVLAWGAVGKLLTPQIEKREAELAAERAIKAQGEAFRKALHLALIERIKSYVEQAKGLPSERIAAGMAFVQALTFGDSCQEFLPQYRAAQESALALLTAMRDDAKAREDAEALRLENERIAVELAAQRRALEGQAAELKRQQEAARAVLVAQTHSIKFEWPARKCVSATASSAPTPAPVADPVAGIPIPKPDGEPAMPLPPIPTPTPAPFTEAALESAKVISAAPPALITTMVLGEHLGLEVKANLIASLGFASIKQTKPGTYWKESDVPSIRAALVNHISTHRRETAAA